MEHFVFFIMTVAAAEVAVGLFSSSFVQKAKEYLFQDMNLIVTESFIMTQVALSLLFLPFLCSIYLMFLRKHGNIAALLSVYCRGILAFLPTIFAGEDSVFAWSTTWFALSNFQLNLFFGDSPAKTLLFVVSFVDC